MVAENPEIKTAELAEKCDVVIDTINYHIKNLKKQNKLKRDGGKNGGKWVVIS